MATESKALANSHSSLQTKCASTSVRRALVDRLLPSEAIDLVGKLVAAFPNGGQNAGKSYIGALAAVLCDYPRMVATRCCNPREGVARETRFLPTIADLVAYCERETTEMRRPIEREDHWGLLIENQRRLAQAEATPKPAYSLKQMEEKHGPNFGLGAKSEDQATRREHVVAVRAANDRAWARMEGGVVSAGIPITPALLAAMKAKSEAAE